MFPPGTVMVDAAEYDMLPRVASRPVVGLGVGRAWAGGDVFCAWTEAVRIVRIEAMCDSKAEEGRGDEECYGSVCLGDAVI